MSIDPKSFDQPRKLDLAALAAASRAGVLALVPALLDRWLAVKSPDHELLEQAGKTLAKVGHAGLDRPAMDWVDADPGEPRRLELAAWFLSGYWQIADQALPEARIRLAEALDHLDTTSMAYMGVMTALAMVTGRRQLAGAEERARVRALLVRHLDHLESTKQLPGLTSQIQWLKRVGKSG